MARTLTLKALADVLAAERGQSAESLNVQLCRWSRRPGFPVDRKRGAKPLFDLDEVRAWLDANTRSRRPELQSSAIPQPLPARELDAHEAALVRVLEDPGATDLERAEAGYALASKIVATAHRAGNLGVQQLENLKKQGEELRKAKADAIDLAERRGELIGQDIAKAVAGALVLRLLEILNNIENMLATQFEIWMADQAFRALATDERTRRVRAWLEDYARTLRQAEYEVVIAAIKREEEAA
jgi:hypothetical protein